MDAEQPNFLFLITDQQRADHLGCYGNQVINTPNVDAISARGLTFDQFYVACPICMPNRATLMTGRMPSVNGVMTNGVPLPLQSTTFVELLRAAGYRTALLGKSHLQNMVPSEVEDWNYPPRRSGTLPPPGLDDAYRTLSTGPEYQYERSDLWMKDPNRQVSGPYYGFDDISFANLHGDRVQGHYTAWLADRHADPASLRGPENALPADDYVAPQAWRTAMPQELYPTTYVEEMTVQYLDDHAANAGGKPFFIQCSFPDPHHPFTPPGKYWGLYDPHDVAAPESLGKDHNDPPPFQKRLIEELGNGTALRDHVSAYALNDREARESIALTYGMITMVDDAIGRILAKLESVGLAENTVVIFTSDHGDLMGDHGLMLKHCFHQEGLLRVPFIWADPDQPGGARSDLLSGTIDIASTVLARAGLAPYHGIQGYDVVSAATAGEGLPRLGMVIEEDELPMNANCGRFTRTRSFVTGRWRLTYWLEEQFGELYDRENDPLELHNLWNEPAAQADRAVLIEMMMRERISLEEMAPRAPYCA